MMLSEIENAEAAAFAKPIEKVEKVEKIKDNIVEQQLPLPKEEPAQVVEQPAEVPTQEVQEEQPVAKRGRGRKPAAKKAEGTAKKPATRGRKPKAKEE